MGNRAKILTAARLAFTEVDAEVSMAEISRRANVGMATLYRNFAGRRELLEAVYADEVNAICQAAGQDSGSSDGEKLTSWLRQFFFFVTGKRHVAAALLKHADDGDPMFADSRARVTEAAHPLLAAAKHTGEVRPELSLDQILDMVHALAMIAGDSQYIEPILQSALRGIRTSPPLDADQPKPPAPATSGAPE